MIANLLNTPPNGPLHHHHPDEALISPGAVHTIRWTSHVLSKTIMWVSLWLNFCLSQQHHVKKTVFHFPDGLRQPKAPAIPDVQCRDSKPGWASVPALRRWQSRVQAVGIVGYWLVKGKWHPSWKQKDEKVRRENPRIGCFRIYGWYFSVAPFLGSGLRQPQRVAIDNVSGCLVWGRHPLACLRPRFHL